MHASEAWGLQQLQHSLSEMNCIVHDTFANYFYQVHALTVPNSTFLFDICIFYLITLFLCKAAFVSLLILVNEYIIWLLKNRLPQPSNMLQRRPSTTGSWCPSR